MKDLSDIHAAAGADGLLAAVEKTRHVSGLPPRVRGDQIAAKKIVLPAEVVEGMLHCGAKMVLGAGSKSFKTWCLADLGISIATGRPWWGRSTKQGRVVYLNLEVQSEFFEQRLQLIAQAKGCTLPADLEVWHLRGFCADHRALLPQLAAALAGEGLAAIILDPTYKVMNGSENAQEEVAALMDSIEKLTVSTGAAAVFGSHFAKGNAAGKAAIDRISGSGVFARDPDAILTMTEHEEDGVFVVDPILRNCPPIAPFCVRWEFPLMQPSAGSNPEKLKKPKTGRGATFDDSDILSILKEGGGMTTGEWLAACKEDGIRDSTFYRLRRSAKNAGRIKESKVERGQWNAL